MFRKVVMGAALCSAAFASSALAADIYSPGGISYKDQPAYVPVTTWTGFYIGVNGGYGGNSGVGFRDNTFVAATGDDFRVINGSSNLTGGFGGGQFGYNYQFGAFVVGFETDIEGSDIRGNGALSQTVVTGGVPVGRFGTAAANIDYFGTVRGRLGYSLGNFLIYGTGGFAYGGTRTSFGISDTAGATGFAAHSSTPTGWVAGGGVEYKMTPNWSLKGEYQYVDLGNFSVSAPLTVPAGYVLRGSSDLRFNTVRVGVNYYFNAAYEPLPLK